LKSEKGALQSQNLGLQRDKRILLGLAPEVCPIAVYARMALDSSGYDCSLLLEECGFKVEFEFDDGINSSWSSTKFNTDTGIWIYSVFVSYSSVFAEFLPIAGIVGIDFYNINEFLKCRAQVIRFIQSDMVVSHTFHVGDEIDIVLV